MAAIPSDRSGLHAPWALLPDGWAASVEIRTAEDGTIREVRTGASPSALPSVEGPVIPGMPDVHSHAFQRALLGRTQALHGDDDFWSWRHLMYRLVSALEPEDVQVLSAWVYADLLAHGYTSVAEFHYLHRDRDGSPYTDVAELSHRIVAAAADSGIGLTLLPVLYRRSGFDGRPLEGPARRFGLTLDEYDSLLARLDADAVRAGYRVGLAPHSLRAVDEAGMAVLTDRLRREPDRILHLHAAEQPAEVAACVSATGRRPVEWLIEHAGPGARWTVIHATHTSATERRDLIDCGARIGLCPTTEADLGDGAFPLADWIGSGGRFGIGSDSNVSVSPLEELRLLAYTSRLSSGRRGALPLDAGRPVGAQLWQAAARDGGTSMGLGAGEIRPGCRCDLLVLDAGAPWAAALSPDELLDAFVLSGDRSAIRRTIASGRTVAEHGRHQQGDRIAEAARQALGRVFARLG